MKNMTAKAADWYAIKTRQDFRSVPVLETECEEVFFPTEEVMTPAGHTRTRAIIPHVLFIRTDRENALRLERRSHAEPGAMYPFWIYRYLKGGDIQIITGDQIRLLRLLTAGDTTRCEIYGKKDFTGGQRVRVTGGFYKGYEGTVRRVRKNRHVVIEIKGICMIMLPFIHPDLLEIIPG